MNRDIAEIHTQITAVIYWHEPPKNDAEKVLRAQAEIVIRQKAQTLERGVAEILKAILPTGGEAP